MASSPPVSQQIASSEESPSSAQTVGNQFVSQYYTVLHASPKHLHRFYSDRSTLTYIDVGPDGSSSPQDIKTATGQKKIHEIVMNMGHDDNLTEIYSVDAQNSVDGGVIVMVTGCLQAKEQAKRLFVQTFYLAVQEKGYFVLNDIFRFLVPSQVTPPPPPPPTTNDTISRPSTAAAAAAAKPSVSSLSSPPGSQQQGAASSKRAEPQPPPPQQKANGSTPASRSQQQQQLRQEDEKPSGMPVNGQRSSSSSASYAERVRPGEYRTNSTITVTAPSSAETSSAGSPAMVPSTPAAAAGGRATTTSGGGGGAPYPISHSQASPMDATLSSGSGGVHARAAALEALEGLDVLPPDGVFIRDIPHGITLDELTEKLKEFGALKSGSVSLKAQKGRDSYAFADFETSDAAQACITAGLVFGERHAAVVAKRPDVFRRSSSGGRSGTAAAASAAAAAAAAAASQTSPSFVVGGNDINSGFGLHSVGVHYPPPPGSLPPPPPQQQQSSYSRGGQQGQQQAYRGSGPRTSNPTNAGTSVHTPRGMPPPPHPQAMQHQAAFSMQMPAAYGGGTVLVPVGMPGMMPMQMAMQMQPQQMARGLHDGYQPRGGRGGGRGRGGGQSSGGRAGGHHYHHQQQQH